MINTREGCNRHGLLDMILYINRYAWVKELSVLEVGSYKGDSALIFAEHFKLVTCVDAWAPSTFNIKGVDVCEAEREFDRALRGKRNVVKIKGLSTLVAQTYEDRSFNVVYVDASHDYESIKKDLAAWRGKASMFMCGHDYNARHFKGVIRAVNEAFGVPDATFVDHSWLVKMKEAT